MEIARSTYSGTNVVNLRGIGRPVRERSSTSARCTPTSSAGTSRSRATASSNAAPLATTLHAVTIPSRCARMAPSVIPGCRPTSSAVTISRRGIALRGFLRARSGAFAHLRKERDQLAQDLQHHRERTEVGDAAGAREVVDADLLDGEAGVLRLDDQLGVDQ